MGTVALCLACELPERVSCIPDPSTCTQASSDVGNLNWFLSACLRKQNVKCFFHQWTELVKYDHLDVQGYSCTHAENLVFQQEAQAPVNRAKVAPEWELSL